MARWFFLALLLVLLGACSTPKELGPGFDKLSGHFVQAMRWQDFHAAAKFLVEEERERFLEQFPRNKDLHMVDVRFESVDLDEIAGEAETLLLVEYYLLPSPTLKEWSWSQQWRRLNEEFPEKDTWLIQQGPPKFP